MNKKEWISKFMTALLCNLFLFGTVMVFSPLEVFLGNYADFRFSFHVTWQVMVLAALAVVAVVSLVEMLLPKRIALLLNAATVGLGICCYVQMMFLNGKMVMLTGAEMKTTRPERIMNLGVWAGMFLVIGGVSPSAVQEERRTAACGSEVCIFDSYSDAADCIDYICVDDRRVKRQRIYFDRRRSF